MAPMALASARLVSVVRIEVGFRTRHEAHEANENIDSARRSWLYSSRTTT